MTPKYFGSIFKSVQTLEEYLGLDIDELDIPLDDKNTLKELAQQILIAVSNPTEGIYECSTSFTPSVTGVSAMDKNIEDILADICVYILSHWQLSNVLTSGCALAPDRNSIQMKYNNTLLSQIITSKAWNVLFSCVGEQDLYDLFLNTIILHRLPNGAYYQLSGTPLSLGNVTLEPKKRRKSPNLVDQYTSTFLFDIASHHSDLPRYLDSLLFSKKRRKPTKCGDQPSKVQKLSRRQKKKMKDSNTTAVSKSRVVAIDRSQLFYCQNSINPSSGHVVMKLPKDHMLKKGKSSDLNDDFIIHCMSKIFPREFTSPNKIKKFVKKSRPMQQIVKELQRRHNRIHFLQILDRRCPKKLLGSNITRAASQHFEVFELIKEIVRRAFPIKFWGSKDNFDVICTALKHFVSRRKLEKLSMTEIMHKFKVLNCQWLSSSHKQRVVPSDLKKRKMILQQAFAWFFNDFITPTLKSFFYITEHAKFGKQTFYYRRDTWQIITEPRIQSLVTADYFEEMHGAEISLELGAGKIRFLPKENGLRMITNTRNATRLTQGHVQGTFEEQSVDTNDKLDSLLDVLHFEKDRNPDLMGSSVLGRHLLYKRFKSYTKKALPTKSKFYFVKVDISNCFDNIDQIKLLHILEDVLQSGQYLCRKVSSARPFGDKIMQRSLQSLSTTDATSDINGYVGRLANVRPGTILFDQNSFAIKDAKELYSLLRENVSLSAVKFGTKYYKRQHGIAQGSRLSTLLCSFFFGRLEQEKLAYLKQDKDGILFSYIDDFLYITKNKEYAVRFVNTMTTGISDFSVSVNKDKCVTNIHRDIPEFTWLGLIFDTNTLNVHIDKSARRKSDVTYSLTVEFSRRPSVLLLNSGVRAIKSKFYDILMDSEINSKPSLTRNLYDNFEFAALKIECQAKELSTSIMGFINEKCILGIIIRLGQLVIPLAPHGITKSEIIHLFFLAFYNVFKKRQSKYPRLTLYLKSTLKRYTRSTK